MKILICIQYVAYILRIDFDIVTIIWTIIYDKLCNFCAGKNGFSLYEVKVVDLVVTLYFEHLVRFHLIGSSKRSCVSPPRQVFNVPIEPCDGASFNLLLPFFTYLPFPTSQTSAATTTVDPPRSPARIRIEPFIPTCFMLKFQTFDPQ